MSSSEERKKHAATVRKHREWRKEEMYSADEARGIGGTDLEMVFPLWAEAMRDNMRGLRDLNFKRKEE